MTSRTLQSHQPSGCTYVVEYDDIDVISGISDVLDYREAEALTADTLWDVEIYEDDSLWANDQQWGYPVLTAEWPQ